ncbi:hypothetical protein [Nocardia sp. 348MFTsu5.1]|uniref:hypothetical protein n=1 Tax=Nocardia sp. 348MFTsu5.1 TaxID=1172185 RepID=UPI0003661A98|nr:hypothetical protein [Nocardia sp. 348MFTsu5.1]
MAHWVTFVGLTILATIIGGGILVAVRKLIADEVTYQFEQFPERFFFLALAFFPADERERRFDEWAQDFQETLDAHPKRTLKRLWTTTRFIVSTTSRAKIISRRSQSKSLRWVKKSTYTITMNNVTFQSSGTRFRPQLVIPDDDTGKIHTITMLPRNKLVVIVGKGLTLRINKGKVEQVRD